jgi:citrate synthase
MTNPAHPGLDGVVAAETRLSSVDGLHGELIVAGFPIEELAPRASFEETVYLLWHDALPEAGALDALRADLADRRGLPAPTLAVLRAAAGRRAAPIDALIMATSTLRLGLPASASARDEAAALVAAFPALVAAYWRLLHGQAPVPPRADLGHAANYLYMLTGEAPDPARARALDTYWNTVADHGLNASTFTARVIVSTGSDLISALTGALGALKGPLHGGAPAPALDMVFEIGQAERAEAFMRAKLARGERLMGFGHRIYKVRDPRADVLARAAERLNAAGSADRALYDLARQVEAAALALLAEHKPWPQFEDERGVLHRPAAARAGTAGRAVHTHLCRRPGGRLDSPLPGAANGRPADPAAIGLHGAAGPAVAAPGGASRLTPRSARPGRELPCIRDFSP